MEDGLKREDGNAPFFLKGDRKLAKRILGQSTVPWVQFQMVLRDITGGGGSEKGFVGP